MVNGRRSRASAGFLRAFAGTPYNMVRVDSLGRSDHPATSPAGLSLKSAESLSTQSRQPAEIAEFEWYSLCVFTKLRRGNMDVVVALLRKLAALSVNLNRNGALRSRSAMIGSGENGIIAREKA